jgi:hypothetical protein
MIPWHPALQIISFTGKARVAEMQSNEHAATAKRFPKISASG